MLILKNITKDYQLGKTWIIHILRWINLHIEWWDFVSIVWPSGSGKSTLMNIIGMLDTPTSWEYFLSWVRIDTLKDAKMSEIRAKKIGFIFQNYSLLPRISAVDQVMIPLLYQWYGSREARKLAITYLEKVWLGDKLKNRPNELSWGQSQRVAIARALVVNPDIILADEPTWALDSKTWWEILDLFGEINASGKTVILITHDPEVAKKTKKIIKIKDGEIVDDL